MPLTTASHGRRAALAFGAAVGALLCSAPLGAAAQDKYPSTPITLVVPQAAGGANDAIARVLAPRLSEQMGQSVMVDNRPGAVHDLLVPLKRHGVSMSRFESRPARSGQWEYVFFIDLAGHPAQDNVAAALDELRAQCSCFKVLGRYPLDVP